MCDFYQVKRSPVRSYIQVILVVLLSLGCHQILAQSNKEPLSFDDIRQWRSHSVSLSDDGNWYTTSYSLLDEPESTRDTTETDSVENKVSAYFHENHLTDILYVWNADGGLKYEISNGERPVFSSGSDWIAYQIVSDSKDKDEEDNKKDSTFIELKHLESNFTIRYESDASFRFIEDKNYFITYDESSLTVYDLDNRREHFIGNVGEFLTDKNSAVIAYTISSDDKRGNGVYLYDPTQSTTRALITGSFTWSNLAWNHSTNLLAAYKYKVIDDEVDYPSMSIIVVNIDDFNNGEITEYPIGEIESMPEKMVLAERSGSNLNPINWSKDNKRLLLKIKEHDAEKEEKSENIAETKKEKADVQVWHWKDTKLLSERIMEYEQNKNRTFDAIFFLDSSTLVQLTSDEMQELFVSQGTDTWAIGADEREYLSDWDIKKNDLYRIDLRTGEKNLLKKEHRSMYRTDIEMSPDGSKVVLWDGQHFWCYDLASEKKVNISEKANVSFIDIEYDQFGYTPNYGFVGWVKDQNAVLVNHKLDLWLLPIDSKLDAKNLTASVTSHDSIRFRLEDYSFAGEEEIEDRYIDLSESIVLHAFNTSNKYEGFYSLNELQLKELIYGPFAFSSPYRRYNLIRSENSDAIIYRRGDYNNEVEAYLSSLDFTSTKKITDTNPQQEIYAWGSRVLIEYTNDDGVPLQGVLSIPDSYQEGEQLPMIVYSYEKSSHIMYRFASPYLSGTTIPEMLYVSNGYLFLQPDIHFNVGTPHSDMHECIDAAIKEVIELGYVDEDKIGYQGYSFGGHCGMYMSTQDNRFAAIAAGGGVSNLVQGFNLDIVWDGSNEQDYYMIGQGRLGTDPTSDVDMYISESPVFNAHTMNTPLLLFHGTDDKIVQWEHSFGLYSILRYLKKPVILLSYRGEGHGLRNKESTRLDIQRRLKEYFDHYLMGAESKAWMDEESPYLPDKKSQDDGEKGRTLPKWK